MPLIQVTEEATNLLKGRRERVEVFDAAGNLLGVFDPPPPQPPWPSPEELERRSKEPGRPIGEILARLRAAMPIEDPSCSQ